jgi:hypothetical protein
VVADISVIHPATTSYSHAAEWNAGAAAASRDALKHYQYHAGGLPATLSFFPLSVESYGRSGVFAMQFLNALAEAALASSAANSNITKAAFISQAFRELGATLYVGNELVYREDLHVYAAADGTHARMSVHVPTKCHIVSVLVISVMRFC